MVRSDSYAERAAQLFKTAIAILKENGGSMPRGELFKLLEDRLGFDDRDRHRFESGPPRWLVSVAFNSTGAVKAGLMRKSKGVWILTPEGLAVADLPARELMARKNELYQKWRSAKGKEEAASPDEDVELPSQDSTADLALEDAQSRARQGIVDHVNALGPYEFQDLVAALLRSMGYHTPLIAAPGRDGGTDILAYRDPLGTEHPHIRVQVKHRNDKAKREEVAALRGIIRSDREIGLFVSSEGFTAEAVREARQGNVHIELMDLDRLLELWIVNYEKLSEEDKVHLRLVPVHFLAPED